MDALRKIASSFRHFVVALWGRFWPWYRAQTRRMQIVVGSVALVGLCACCGWFSVATTSSTIPHITTAQRAVVTPTVTTAAAATTTKPSATATPKPTSPPQATQPPKATTPPAPRYPAINGNPYDLTLTNTGHLVYNPPSDICTWLNCIASFWTNTSGYVDLCVDGTYSHSGGRTGACSKHGNEKQPVYQP